MNYQKIFLFYEILMTVYILKRMLEKMLIGIFEGKSIPAFNKTNRVPEDFSYGEFPENFEHFEPYLEAALKGYLF